MKNLKSDTMEIKDFVSQFKTHPILFVGSGLSRRYLKESPEWSELLSNISKDIWGNDSVYLDLSEKYNFEPTLIANDYEDLFRNEIKNNPKFENIKKQNEENIRNRKIISPFKIYLSTIFSKLEYKEEINEEIELFKSLVNSIKSIVTTNYDGMLEDLFNFNKLIGNDIIFSKQYGSIYKIHGCYTEPNKIIFTKKDYQDFHPQNKLILAQLISLFIHSPVIFLGYGTDDNNVNSVLETIYTYVGNNQSLRNQIKDNFLLVEYEKDSKNTIVSNFDKTLESGVHLSFNKITTDDYISIYKSILDAPCGIEAGILRLVDNLMERVFVDSKDKNNAQKINYFFDDISGANPSDCVLGVIREKDIEQVKESIVYKDKKVAISAMNFILDYFNIIEKEEIETIKLIDNLQPKVSKGQNFPIFGFAEIISNSTDSYRLECALRLKDNQENVLNKYIEKIGSCNKQHTDINSIFNDDTIAKTAKYNSIFWNVWNENISLSELEHYLKNYEEDKGGSDFRRLIALYDYIKYGITMN